jgi:hypothetical protein
MSGVQADLAKEREKRKKKKILSGGKTTTNWPCVLKKKSPVISAINCKVWT